MHAYAQKQAQRIKLLAASRQAIDTILACDPPLAGAHVRPQETRQKRVDALASQLLDVAQAQAPAGEVLHADDVGAEALALALIRRVGPFAYASFFAPLMPRSSSS